MLYWFLVAIVLFMIFFFFFKQMTAYEMRISDWSSDVCSSDLDTVTDHDKGHGRVEERSVTVSRETDWLTGTRRFPGELRLPGAATIVCVTSRTELKDRCRFDTRYYISSARLSAEDAAGAVRGHWGIENRLHWVLDTVFKEDQSRLRKGPGARNMAVEIGRAHA